MRLRSSQEMIFVVGNPGFRTRVANLKTADLATSILGSALACGAILFARPLYVNLGIGNGVTVLAGCSTMGVGGMFFLYYYGAKLRAKSKFTVKG